MEENGCDYYIISVDQMFSGGIVGSQYLNDKDIEKYGKKMSDIESSLETLMKDKNNHIYLIDSITATSPTAGFMNFTGADYKDFTTFSNVERKELTGDNLKIKTIHKNYKVDKNNTDIAKSMNKTKVNKYLDARKRKLTYSKKVLDMIKNSNNKNIHIYVGIDGDATSSTNIQRNDIAFIKKTAKSDKVKIIMHEGVSTLSEVAFSDMLLDSITKQIQVKITYYGDPTRIVPGTKVNYKEYTDTLLKDLNMTEVEKKPDFELLVYNTVAGKETENSNKLVNQYLNNIHNKIPTVIVNDADLSKDKILIENLINYEKTKVPLGHLIGYSNWNGYINSSRIGVTEGAIRIFYLKGNYEKKDERDKAFLRSMGISYIEDMTYVIRDKSITKFQDHEAIMNEQDYKIRDNLSKSNIISSLNPYEEKGIKSVNANNYTFPWGRLDEISMRVIAYTKERQSLTIPTEVKDHTPKEGDEDDEEPGEEDDE